MSRKTDVLNFIKERMKDSPIYTDRIEGWFEEMLNRAEVNILSDCDPDIKKRYIDYMEEKRGPGCIKEFRAYCETSLVFTIGTEEINRIAVGDKYGKSFKRDIMLHDNNETLESLSWLLLHELGHVYSTALDQYAPLFSAMMRDLNYLNASTETQKAGIDYWDYWDIYLLDDNVHESRPEEVFCNMIATAVIGENRDRIWWRKNCYIEKGD